MQRVIIYLGNPAAGRGKHSISRHLIGDLELSCQPGFIMQVAKDAGLLLGSKVDRNVRACSQKPGDFRRLLCVLSPMRCLGLLW